jgi:hypothetical protein
VETKGGVDLEAKGHGIIVEGAPILHGDGPSTDINKVTYRG